MNQIESLFSRWLSDPPQQENGLIVGSDQRLEWLLPWWWHHYSRYNAYPVTFIDFGMSEQALDWCRQKGQLISYDLPSNFLTAREDIPVDLKVRWQAIYLNKQFWDIRQKCLKKPFAMLMSSYRQTLWTDLDCEIKGNLGPLFATCNNEAGLAIAPEPHQSLENFIKVGLLQPNEKHYNGGVVVYKYGAPLLIQWAKNIIENNASFSGDSGALSSIIRQEKLKIYELPPIYNWRMAQGPNPQAIIIHWVADWGKQHILDEIKNLQI